MRKLTATEKNLLREVLIERKVKERAFIDAMTYMAGPTMGDSSNATLYRKHREAGWTIDRLLELFEGILS